MIERRVDRLASAALAILFLLSLGACSTISFEGPKVASYTLADNEDTLFGGILAQWVAQHPGGESSFYPLGGGMDALGARLRLIEGAEKSIDAQYFLMKDDDAGEVFAGSLLRAADRGVRVRFLLDDVFTTVADDLLALLNAHPNIELRLFNPVSRRGLYYLNYAGDFSRANRRMHSKSLTGDNVFTIIGGRNIADEYFQLRDDTEFLDYDVLAMGPIAAEVSAQFDDFWNSDRAVPMDVLNSKITAEDLAAERAEVASEMAQSIYSEAINSEYMLSLLDGTGATYTAKAWLLHDEAEKLEKPIDNANMTLINELSTLIDQSDASLFVVSPYFIPTREGMDFWKKTINRGLEVTIVTNSLASTNHVPVHGAYSRYRKEMLAMGASVYEIRANAITRPADADEGARQAVTLHTKVIVIDKRYLFVGSLNLDPRSVAINAELGLVIDSPELVDMVMGNAKEVLEEMSYKVELNEKNRLTWHGTQEGKPVIETREPQTSWWRRFQSRLYRVLPESQL